MGSDNIKCSVSDFIQYSQEFCYFIPIKSRRVSIDTSGLASLNSPRHKNFTPSLTFIYMTSEAAEK